MALLSFPSGLFHSPFSTDLYFLDKITHDKIGGNNFFPQKRFSVEQVKAFFPVKSIPN